MNINKLKFAINRSKMSKAQIAKQSGITRVTLDNALQGGDIRISILESLAKTLNVDVGYFFDTNAINNLEERSDVETSIEKKDEQENKIGYKIKELASQENITLAELAKKLGKTKQAVYDIVEKEDVSTAILRQVADIFDVPISSFFSETEQTDSTVVEDRDEWKRRAEFWMKMAEERLEMVELQREVIQMLKDENKKLKASAIDDQTRTA